MGVQGSMLRLSFDESAEVFDLQALSSEKAFHLLSCLTDVLVVWCGGGVGWPMNGWICHMMILTHPRS